MLITLSDPKDDDGQVAVPHREEAAVAVVAAGVGVTGVVGDVGFHGGIFGAGGGVGLRREGWDSEKRYDSAISVGGPWPGTYCVKHRTSKSHETQKSTARLRSLPHLKVA